MTVRRAAVLALAVALCAPATGSAATPKSWPRAFRSCDALLTHARTQAARIAEPAGLPRRPQPGIAFPASGPREDSGAPQAAPADGAAAEAPEHSTTNVQEGGVDEPDLVKTDGRHVFALASGTLRVVDVRGAEPKVVGSLKLGGFSQEMLLAGDRLMVFSTPGYGDAQPLAADLIAQDPRAVLTEIDVSDRSNPRVVRTLDVDGSYVSARMRGTTARVVIASYPRPIPVADGDAPEVQRRRAAIRRTHLKTWIPRYRLTSARGGNSVTRSLVGCRATRRPAVFSGLGMLTVLTIDLSKGIVPVDSDGLMTDARTVYASQGSLYVASERWLDPTPESGESVPGGRATTIHRFDARDSDHTTFRASGTVRGYLLNQWALSEYRDHLRVATTEEPLWWGGGAPQPASESFVTTLAEDGGELRTRGQVGGLGRGERIYSVRFIEDQGYVVTFRQVDPLYVVDLSNPAKPAVAGELKVLGYSAYLHPVGRDLLLGVGQDASEEGRTQGTQVSLFDVSDPRQPRRTHRRTLAGAGSEAEYDHHAFLWWPGRSLAVIPIRSYPRDGGEPFVGAVGFGVAPATGIDEVGRIAHPQGSGGYVPDIRRALVVGDRLFTVSDAGIKASRLDTLGDVAFAPFG
ncbi:MAG TPA: beta-propeller domain-containing protein [Thermoleophilaceae bacterium]